MRQQEHFLNTTLSVTAFGKLSESFSLLWSGCPGTDRYAASASSSWLLEKVAVFLSPPPRPGYLLPKVVSPYARISAVTTHSPAPLCELIRELCLGLWLPAVSCGSQRSDTPLFPLPLLQIAATFTRREREINNSECHSQSQSLGSGESAQPHLYQQQGWLCFSTCRMPAKAQRKASQLLGIIREQVRQLHIKLCLKRGTMCLPSPLHDV